MVCNEKKDIFFNFNAYSRISLSVPAHSLSYVKVIEKHFRISEILYWFEKTNHFAEFNVHLIHKKQVPLLHNTVLILCNEGVGSVAMNTCFCAELIVCWVIHAFVVVC